MMRQVTNYERAVICEALIGHADAVAGQRADLGRAALPSFVDADAHRKMLATLDDVEGAARRLATEIGLGDVQIGHLR